MKETRSTTSSHDQPPRPALKEPLKKRKRSPSPISDEGKQHGKAIPRRRSSTSTSTSNSPKKAARKENHHNNDFCHLCLKRETARSQVLFCCDNCPRAFCLTCLKKMNIEVPTSQSQDKKVDESQAGGDGEGDAALDCWICPKCTDGTTAREERGKKMLSPRALKPLTSRHHGRSLLEFLQLIELHTSRSRFISAMDSIRPFLNLPRADTAGPVAHNSLNFQLALSLLRRVLGAQTFDDLYQEVQDSPDICHFFGARASEAEEHRCDKCHKFRVLRTVCLWCGTPFDPIRHVHKYIRSYEVTTNHYEELCSQLEAEAPPEVKERLEKKEIKIAQLVEEAKNDALGRFLDYFEDRCLKAPGNEGKGLLFQEKGGDMIFLTRNLAFVAPERWKDRCFGMLEKLSLMWMNQNSKLSEMGEELDDIFGDTLEGLHTIHQIGIEEITFDEGRERKTAAASGGSGSESANSSSASSPSSSPGKGKRKTRGSNIASRVNFGTFKVCDLKTQLLQRGPGIEASECFNYDPTRDGGLPMTEAYHCGHCGYDVNDRRARTESGDNCEKCGCTLRSHVDWGALTDALVWTHVARELGMELAFHRGLVTVEDVLCHMPKIRKHYQTLDYLGNHFFRLQGFFITHFLYCMSNWGTYRLRKELFIEEFQFIVANFQACLRTSDCELVGEFIQCLTMFGISPRTDPEFQPYINEGIAFLILQERKLGKKGKLPIKDCEYKRYSRYHVVYCAAIALMDNNYHPRKQREEGEQEEYLIPNLFKRQLSEQDLNPPLHPFIKERVEANRWMQPTRPQAVVSVTA